MPSASGRTSDFKKTQSKTYEGLGYICYIRNNNDDIISNNIYLINAYANGDVFEFIGSSGVTFAVTNGTTVKDLVVKSLVLGEIMAYATVGKTVSSDGLLTIKNVKVSI